EESAKGLLGRPVRRAVVVREVEMGDAEVERSAHDGAAALKRRVTAEVLPESERDRRQVQPGDAGSAVLHLLVAVVGRRVCHSASFVMARSSSPCVAPVMLATASGIVCHCGVTAAQ